MSTEERDRLAALLDEAMGGGYVCELPSATVADMLIAAGVTLAYRESPDPGVLDVARLAQAMHNIATPDGEEATPCLRPSAHFDDAQAVADAYAALSPEPTPEAEK